MLSKVAIHAARLSYHLGRRMRLGDQSYKVKGYMGTLLPNRSHEAYMGVIFQKILAARDGTFVDVGVNSGQTLLKILAADRHRRYIGFEPQVACCHNLQDFLMSNGVSSAAVLPIALSDRNGILELYSHGPGDEMAGLLKTEASAGEMAYTQLVPAWIGDEAMSELGVTSLCAIKIDVEGAELQVLRGLRESISSMRPALVFEVLPNFYGIRERVMLPPAARAANQASAEAIFEFVVALDYAVFQISEDGIEHPISRFDLDDRVNYVGSNYVAYPRV